LKPSCFHALLHELPSPYLHRLE
jgi:hypothetical protein